VTRSQSNRVAADGRRRRRRSAPGRVMIPATLPA